MNTPVPTLNPKPKKEKKRKEMRQQGVAGSREVAGCELAFPIFLIGNERDKQTKLMKEKETRGDFIYF